MKVVTAWYRALGNALEFNHISDGFDPSNLDTPPPQCEEHRRMWRNGIWVGRPATLSDDLPAKLTITKS